MREQTNPNESSGSSRVVVTVLTGAAGMLVFIVGAVLAIWSYAANGFDFTDWKLYGGFGGMIGSLFLFALLLLWNQNLHDLTVAERRTLYGYNIFLSVVFLGAVLVLVNVFLTQYGYLLGVKQSYDWTSQGVFTLSSVSVQQVQALQKPVKFIAVYQRGTRRQVYLEQIFELYKAASKQISYEIVDPSEDRIATDDLFKKYPGAQSRDPSVIVTYGEGNPPPHKVVKDSEINKTNLQEVDMMSMRGGGDTEFHGENALTSAIRSLVEDKKTVVYFTAGHGEKDLNESSTREVDGIGLLKQRFTELNIKAEPVNLLGAEVPQDGNILVIAGPKRTFQPDEVSKIRDFMERRDSKNERTSRLIVLFDSPGEMRRGEPADAGLGELLAAFDVNAKPNIVYDRAAAIRRMDQIVVACGSESPGHAIVDPLKGEAIVMFQAREIASNAPVMPPGMPPQQQPPQRADVKKLFSTSAAPLSWADSEWDADPSPGGAKDTPGPVCVGVAVSDPEATPPSPHGMGSPPPPAGKSTPRLVVFGDATFISNPLIAQFAQNEDLFLNSINWLGGRTTDIGIQPRVKKYLRLNLDTVGYYKIILEPMFHILGTAAFLSGLVWVIRSERFRLLWIPALGTIFVVLTYAGLLKLLAGSVTTPETMISVLRLTLTTIFLWTLAAAIWLGQPRATVTPR